LSAGKVIRASGESSYELFEQGEHVGRLEIFEAPRLDGNENSGLNLNGRSQP
jgi:hypothetical protein